ncbi:SdrD B-like domain-containing protein [Streptomyces sp. NPDC048172]|uniref:SdrD B-like domain-containing protein n=1 Tax=Streptomyces sp. NPDC048172 TaxID=3365505 RepID=UPI0037126B92
MAALATGVAAATVLPSGWQAGADAGDGGATVRVVREVNGNGRWDDALEPGMRGVEVVLTDTDGRSVTGTTGADGTVRLEPGTRLQGGRYRVEVKNPKPGVLHPGFAASKDDLSDPGALSSHVEFVDLSGGRDAEVTTSFWNPGDYCQKNADLATACIKSDVPGQADPDSARTLVTHPYNARGNDAETTDLATKGETGSLWGLGYSKQKKWLFSSAFAKRGAEYGPGGPGAIYLTDRETGELTQFTTVPNAGTTEHDVDTDMDLAFRTAVGKESLGDIDVSDDGKDLYAVNLNDRKLYRYDATRKTASAPKASYAIPDPGCPSGDDWRPFGLGEQDGTVYVGGVCSGESTQDRDDLRAVIQTFDPDSGSFTGTVMDEKLTYPRGKVYVPASCPGDKWFPWRTTVPDTQDGADCQSGQQDGREVPNPAPLLSDIVVDTDGELILGFRDRFADQYGAFITYEPGDTSRTVQTFAGGDLNRACEKGGTFALDANGGCRNNATPANSGGQDPDVAEFYPGDHRIHGSHQETALGGVALSKVEDTVATTLYDPIDNAHTSGTGFFNRSDGTIADGQGNELTSSFGKAGGMGDLEVLCDEAPLQIGNRVWYDEGKHTRDGIQDPDEKPVVGATVNLYDASGKKIATTKTNARGEYYFDSTLLKNVDPADWVSGREYTVRLDDPADRREGEPLDGWVPTPHDQGGNREIDSNGRTRPGGDGYPFTEVTLGEPGRNDHTLDFGFVRPKAPSSRVVVTKKDARTGKPLAGAVFQLWQETNGRPGLQRTGSRPDTRRDRGCATDGRGRCVFADLGVGSYYLVETAVPDGYVLPRRTVTPLKVTAANSDTDPVEITLTNQPDRHGKKK